MIHLGSMPLTASEGHPRQGLRGLDAVDRADVLHDDVPNRVEGVGLHLGDEIVLAEQRVELHDLRELDQLLVDLFLPVGLDVNQDEADGRGASLSRRTSGL